MGAKEDNPLLKEAVETLYSESGLLSDSIPNPVVELGFTSEQLIFVQLRRRKLVEMLIYIPRVHERIHQPVR